MSSIFSANRIAAIAAFLTGLSAAVLAITNNFPHNWQNSALAIAGIIGAIGTALHFMLGSQKFDALTAATPDNTGASDVLSGPPESGVTPDIPFNEATTPDSPSLGLAADAPNA